MFMLECGSDMDAKKKMLSILALGALKHVDSCFQYLSDKEVQRKPYKTVHDFDISFLPSTMFSFLQPWFNVIWRQFSHSCAKMFSDFTSCWAGVMWIFPVRKPLFQQFRQRSPFPCWEVVLPTWMFSWKFAHWYLFKVLLCHVDLPVLLWKVTCLVPLLLNFPTLHYRSGVSEMIESDSFGEPQRSASQGLLKTTQERVFLANRGTIRGSGSSVVWLIFAVSCWASGLHMKAVSLMCAGHWGVDWWKLQHTLSIKPHFQGSEQRDVFCRGCGFWETGRAFP